MADASTNEAAAAERIHAVSPVAFCGRIEASMALSGVAIAGDYLALGADEGHSIKILRRHDDAACWQLQQTVPLGKMDQETDIEALAYGDGHLYVVGSHSFRRRRLKPELPLRRNQERLLQVQQQPERNRLFRLPLDHETGETGPPESIDLSKRLRKDPLLRPFHGLPSKENGIDIEGMAYAGGRLYLGFRGPVLRGNFVPVMVLRFDKPKAYDLLFVQLEGQGIRDMVALEEGFLILSGPVNDAPGPFQLWWWDGADQIPGKDRAVQPAWCLGAVTTWGGAKAEGLGLIGQDAHGAEVMLVYETSTATQAVSLRVDLRR